MKEKSLFPGKIFSGDCTEWCNRTLHDITAHRESERYSTGRRPCAGCWASVTQPATLTGITITCPSENEDAIM